MSPITPTPAPDPQPAPPAANPKASGSGSCDVSLSDALYGQDYLTASVDVDNTGNIAQVVEVTVRWPQQGFAPIVRHRQLHVPAGQSRTAHLHAPVTSEQVSRFQDRQLASDGDPCHYRLDLISTYAQLLAEWWQHDAKFVADERARSAYQAGVQAAVAARGGERRYIAAPEPDTFTLRAIEPAAEWEMPGGDAHW